MSVGRRILAVPIRCANRQCNLNTIQRKVAKESKERKETHVRGAGPFSKRLALLPEGASQTFHGAAKEPQKSAKRLPVGGSGGDRVPPARASQTLNGVSYAPLLT